jgi:RimJ/RimL family protein N-acetyltransferase
MVELTPDQAATLRGWFVPDRPGPLVGLHVIQTGNGACWADRWPDPRAVLVETAGNYSFAGEPEALQPADLKPLIAGFVEAPAPFVPLLRAAFSNVKVWDRVILELQTQPHFALPRNWIVRRIDPVDVPHLLELSSETAWVAKTWGGAAGLAASGYAWGSFADDRLISVACTFFLGERYEEIGVATEPGFRGQGLSLACAGALCEDIQRRGRLPSWSTSPDNIASVRVAEKLGFSVQRRDCLYVVGVALPEPARRQPHLLQNEEAAGLPPHP